MAFGCEAVGARTLAASLFFNLILRLCCGILTPQQSCTNSDRLSAGAAFVFRLTRQPFYFPGDSLRCHEPPRDLSSRPILAQPEKNI
jgi:hypothetical protein